MDGQKVDDIDNVEDFYELEARLYSQIHHESTNEVNTAKQTLLYGNGDEQMLCENTHNEQSYDTSSNNDIIMSHRYWASGQHAKQQQQRKHLIRNPFKTPNKNNEHRRGMQPSVKKTQQQSKHVENLSKTLSNPLKSNAKIDSSIKIHNKLETEKTSTLEDNALNIAPLSNNENRKSAEPKLTAEKSNLKLNPVADWMKRKKNYMNKKSTGKSNTSSFEISKKSSLNIKQGLFARQQQKLDKAKRIEEKRQKTKKTKNVSAPIANKVKPFDIIDLDSANESDSSDIIILPPAQPPTFIVEDSPDENDKETVTITMEHEENALDSTDVQLASTTSFIKPREITTQSFTTADGDERRLENSSRCTSPCSIQSSDDFIRSVDQLRLASDAKGMADDEDLIVLTSDINSLLEVSEISKQTGNNVEKSKSQLNCSAQDVEEDNVETNDALEFATPNTNTPQSRPKDYRVDQGQFRALDVYESESDITDSIYSKGVKKSTVIRQIDTSSDEVEDISSCSKKTKRFRKRRASSSNKESDPNNDNLSSGSEYENVDDDNKVLRTPIPYIAKGEAIEHYKSLKRNRTLSARSPNLQRRKSASNMAATTDHMSDNEFLATLNNLSQGQDEEQETQMLEKDDESETEHIPTAREIAEKVLVQHKGNYKTNESSDDIALPKNVLNDLGKVFETIDQLDRPDPNDDKISDSSDSDREKKFVYKSLPNEDAQIIKVCPKTSTIQDKIPAKIHVENMAPIYNVIYIRGIRKPGGIGWNDEMRNFYNNSWNGENFIVSKVLQKMNPDKSSWKIYTEDRFSIKSNKRSNIKCMNCCEFGHMRSKCKRPKKPLICYMCGESGHYEPRCPNTICLRCGNKTQVFTKSCNSCSYQNRLTCPICKIRGHSLDYCPDKWRRYHSTTEANIHPSNKVHYNPRRYCCTCGGRGHISDYCRSSLRFLEYPAITSAIKSHQKSYSDVAVRSPFNGIAVNLMYDPFQEYTFDLAEKATPDKYYGRFLKAVGMDYLFKHKSQLKTMSMENVDFNAKNGKRLLKRYVANPYLKAGSANRKLKKPMQNAPDQVQEITESGNTDQQNDEKHLEENVINIEEKSDNEVELIECGGEEEEEELTMNLQLNTINDKSDAIKRPDENFKPPKNVTSTSLEKAVNPQPEPSLILDSDSNYSFSEHFDVCSSSVKNEQDRETAKDSYEELNEQGTGTEYLLTASSKRKPRKMEALPEFIPLIDSTKDQGEENDIDNFSIGISRKFVAADSNDDEMRNNHTNLSPLSELPCEAKIYLTHFHSKYLLSPIGNAFLVKISRIHKLKASLDFTSVGYVLIIFGFPSNQDKFQRELLMKYRELEDEKNQKQVQSNLSVPKRTYVLIRFLRENIGQLMNNLGNANSLLNRLQFHERQQTKSGHRMAEKVRRSLNMILIGQAGLQDGTMHLDKLLVSLKTLLNEVTADVAPPELRSEILNHWKVIFSAYRHENYQKLVATYNKLISKNRLPQLNIDPVLLGQKFLDTSFSEAQKQRLEQARIPELLNDTDINTESSKQNAANSLNQKNTKLLKRKQNTGTISTSSPALKTTPNLTKTKTTLRKDKFSSTTNIKSKPALNNTHTLFKSGKTTAKTNPKNTIINTTEICRKRPQKVNATPPFSNPKKGTTLGTTIQELSNKWKSSCDTLLTQISSEQNTSVGGISRDSKIPSTFWSRESMRYLDDCIRLATERSEIVEKLLRIQNKSKNGQLSYNDYLAVIKLHTALNGK